MGGKLGAITKQRLLMAMDQVNRDIRKSCEKLKSNVEEAACKQGGLMAIGMIGRELGPDADLAGNLGIIVGKKDTCPKGFETVRVKSPKNPNVKICRLSEDVRRLKPSQRPKGKPLRRKSKYGPGIEIEEILPRKESKMRRAEREIFRKR